jgi:hypothetical protein
LVKDCKSSNPRCFILAKVDKEKLCVTAKARTDSSWEDLDKKVNIPIDPLDPVDLPQPLRART